MEILSKLRHSVDTTQLLGKANDLSFEAAAAKDKPVNTQGSEDTQHPTQSRSILNITYFTLHDITKFFTEYFCESKDFIVFLPKRITYINCLSPSNTNSMHKVLNDEVLCIVIFNNTGSLIKFLNSATH